MKKINKQRLLAAGLGIVFIIELYLLWRGGLNLGGLLLAALCLFASIFLFISRQPINLLLMIFSVGISYFIAELGLYVLLRRGFEKLNPSHKTFYSKDAVKADAIAGYRFKPDTKLRTIRYIHGLKVYDNIFQTNNLGYVAPLPFVREKPAGTYRIVWLGDSYSEGIFLQKSYPNRIADLFAAQGKKVEIYNFSIDGGGINNWYRIFFNEILPLDFDAIVIASFMDNLDRDLAIFHTLPDGFYFRRTPITTRSELTYQHLDSLMRLKESKKVADVLDEKKDYRGRDNDLPFNLYLYAYLEEKFNEKFNKQAPAAKSIVVEDNSGLLPGLEPFAKRHGTEKMRQLSAMLDTCRKMNKDILLASVPNAVQLQSTIQQNFAIQNEHQQELSAIAYLYGADYFDGYEVYKGKDFTQLMKEAWLTYDGHWGQKGSDMFAEKLFGYLNSSKSKFRIPGKE